MLSPQQLLVAAPRRRPLRSLRQQFDLYIMDRIEHYKNSLSRSELMRLADDAMAEMGGPDEGQFLLTELLVQEAVDELIKRRLGIRGFESWRKSYPKRRAAQRDPGHWGLDPYHLISGLAPRLEVEDPVLVVGCGGEACAYLLAAHDANVTFLDRDFGIVERAEARIAQESLSSTFDAVCVQFGQWLPLIEEGYLLVVLDAGTLASLTPGERRTLLAELQRITAHGGMHALIPDAHGSGPEGFAGHYATWQRESLPHPGKRGRANPAQRGALFVKPALPSIERNHAEA